MYKFIVSTTKEATSNKLSILLHGDPKVGKTKLITTLPVSRDERLLYIPGDPGDLILRDREYTRLSTPNNIWSTESLRGLYDWCVTKTELYDWIVVDGLDDISVSVLNERKAVNTNPLKAYDEMQSFMDQWIRNMRDIDNVNIIFITHTSEKEDKSTGSYKYSPYVPGKVLPGKIDQYFDIILCMRFIQTEDGIKRKLQCTRDADVRYDCGDRSGSLFPIEEPDLGAIINKIRASVPGSFSDKVGDLNRIRLKIKNIMSSGDDVTDLKKFTKDYFKGMSKTPGTATPDEMYAYEKELIERSK